VFRRQVDRAIVVDFACCQPFVFFRVYGLEFAEAHLGSSTSPGFSRSLGRESSFPPPLRQPYLVGCSRLHSVVVSSALYVFGGLLISLSLSAFPAEPLMSPFVLPRFIFLGVASPSACVEIFRVQYSRFLFFFPAT